MNVLFITHHFLGVNNGGAYASRANINAFAELADHVTVLFPSNDVDKGFVDVNPLVEMVPVEYSVPKYRKLFNFIIGRVHRFYEIAPSYILSKRYDVIVFDNSKTSFRLIKIAKDNGCKTIVIHHNYEYEFARDNSISVLKPIALYWNRKFEREAVRHADLNLTLTYQDLDLLASNLNDGNKESFRYLGTFEYKSSEIRELSSSSCGKKIVITGSLCDRQTRDSLVPWLKSYYPILKDVYNDFSLTIAGRNPDDTIIRMCDERQIDLIASPVSMDPIMKDADIFICPTCLGGGIKLRVMDGLKWGIPVVAHEVSARGYDAFVESGFLYPYNDEKTFRKAIISLKNKLISPNDIYNTYLQTFSFDAGVERLRSILSCFIS